MGKALANFRFLSVYQGWGPTMQIGEPQRVIVVEPLELPVGHPEREPEPEPAYLPVPEPEPEKVPVAP